MEIYSGNRSGTRSNTWPYPNIETGKEMQGGVITLDELELVANLTGSTVPDIYYGLNTLRTGYELGLVELKSKQHATPEEAMIKGFLEKVRTGIYVPGTIRNFFGKIGGIRGFVDGIVNAVRASKNGKFKI